jgi:hypothetical protein
MALFSATLCFIIGCRGFPYAGPDRLVDGVAMPDDSFLNSPRSRYRAALLLAIVADAIQIVVFPLFVEGAISPLDDILDLGVMAAMVTLIGWNWEFLPSFIGKLVPGVDLVPFWTLAVAKVYRKWKQTESDERKTPTHKIIDVEPIERNLPDS